MVGFLYFKPVGDDSNATKRYEMRNFHWNQSISRGKIHWNEFSASNGQTINSNSPSLTLYRIAKYCAVKVLTAYRSYPLTPSVSASRNEREREREGKTIQQGKRSKLHDIVTKL